MGIWVVGKTLFIASFLSLKCLDNIQVSLLIPNIRFSNVVITVKSQFELCALSEEVRDVNLFSRKLSHSLIFN